VIDEITISDYLSFHNEFDQVAAEAGKRLVYDRRNQKLNWASLA
jgi:hypothetical protein